MKADNRQQILTKAIEKAIAGGWDFFSQLDSRKGEYIWFDSPLSNYWDVRNKDNSLKSSNIPKSPDFYNQIIFNHEFAKGLWGLDRLICDSCHVDIEQDDTECWNCSNKTFVYAAYQNTRDNLPNWQYHLQQMVIADDPIAYLGEHI